MLVSGNELTYTYIDSFAANRCNSIDNGFFVYIDNLFGNLETLTYNGFIEEWFNQL